MRFYRKIAILIVTIMIGVFYAIYEEGKKRLYSNRTITRKKQASLNILISTNSSDK